MSTASITPARNKRGFTLMLALIAFALASAILAWSLSRVSIRALAASAHVDTYRKHHDALSYRDIAKLWMGNISDRDSVEVYRLVHTPGPHYVAMLPTGVRLEFYLRDTQGRVMTNFARINDPQSASRTIDLLAKIPDDRGDLVRMFGPQRISVYAAEDLILDAIADGDPDLGLALKEFRNTPPEDDAPTLLGYLIQQGFERSTGMTITTMLTDRPMLFAVDIRALPPESRGGLASRRFTEYYSIEVEARSQTRTTPLAWRTLTQEQFEQYHSLQ